MWRPTCILPGGVILPFLAAISAAGCGGRAPRGPQDLRSRLAEVGLELVAEEEAAVPESEAGWYVPVRVIRGSRGQALHPHPAGYLIFGAGSPSAHGAAAILAALEAWRPGEPLVLAVRRNPYLQAGSEWWEAEVTLR